jgi:hypothetical protein
LRGLAASLQAPARAGEIDQDLPHEPGANPEEVSAILPTDVPEIDQPQVDFVYERRGLKDMAGRFASHITLRKLVKFGVHQGRQLLQRTFVPVAPGLEQLGYLVSGGPRPTTPPHIALAHPTQNIPAGPYSFRTHLSP